MQSANGVSKPFAVIVAESYTGWWVGLTLGFLVVVVVVLVVAAILTFASRVARQAETASFALAEVGELTAPLGDVADINRSAIAILEAAKTARGALTGA